MAIQLSRAQVRLVDKIAIEEYGIPGIVLMENAARAVFDSTVAALDFLLFYLKEKRSTLKISVICGGGNNGGDGYAAARLLHNYGFPVYIYSLTDPKKLLGDAAINRRIVEKMQLKCMDVLESSQLQIAMLEWRDSKAIVDAILGTGFSGELKPHMAKAIRAINEASALNAGPSVVAVDVPSGLDCDSGIPSEPTVRADYTVTFVAPKVGFATPDAQELLGQVRACDIGAPPEIAERVAKMGASI